MAHRDFTITPTQQDPPTFSVAGREFKCLPEPPAGVLTDLIASAEGSPVAQTIALVGFISGCMSDADAEAFQLLIHDKDTIVPLETLGHIVEWLTEQYSDRPTTPPSSSPAGSPPTAATSEGGSSSTDSTPPSLDL